MRRIGVSLLAAGFVWFGSAASSTADQVFNDDVIVTFSLCVGNDCNNGESFGFDTLRLKENNLRIHFDDTSTSASFPSNDWRIVINDSANGGTNHFSVEDSTAGRSPFRIEAGASANALVIEADSDIGIGTLNPVVELHVVDGDSPTLRLEQDGSSGFTPQTFDLVANEANFFIRDVTNGSQLPFRIKPGADSDALFIAANNEIGLGTDSPGADLHVRVGGSAFAASSFTDMLVQDNANATDAAILTLLSGDGTNGQVVFGTSADEFRGRLVFDHTQTDMRVFIGGSVELEINDSTAPDAINTRTGATLTQAGVWMDVSSREAKENIAPVSYETALATVMDVTPVTYNYKVAKDDDNVGFIAEDVPELVAAADRKHLSSMDITAVLTRVVQEQQASIQQQQQIIATLSERVAELEIRTNN